VIARAGYAARNALNDEGGMRDGQGLMSARDRERDTWDQAAISRDAGGARAVRPQVRNTAANSCLLSLIAVTIALSLFVVLTGVVIGRIGGWLDFNPFGLFAAPETRIDTSRATVVTRMQALGRLETQHFTIEQVIEAERSGNALQNVFFGDRILLIANGQVIAGVDLTRLGDADVQIDDARAAVTLPASEIFIATLNNEETRVYDRDRGLLSRGDSQLETEARQAAEQSILRAACDQGILDRAASEAATQIETLLRLLEFEDVQVTAPVGTCPAERE
jgi:hypothetical protein